MSKTIRILGQTGTYADLGRRFGVDEKTIRQWILKGNTDSVIEAKLLARGCRVPTKDTKPAAEKPKKKKPRKVVFHRASSSSGYYTWESEE